MKDSFSVLKGGALRRQSRAAEPTVFPEAELMKMWEIDTEEYAVATGIPLEDVRDRVMPFEGWLAEQGFAIQAVKEAQPVDDQVTGMIVLALHGVKMVGGAWDTYLNMKKPGVLPDVLAAQVDMVRRDANDAIGTLQSILSRLLLY